MLPLPLPQNVLLPLLDVAVRIRARVLAVHRRLLGPPPRAPLPTLIHLGFAVLTPWPLVYTEHKRRTPLVGGPLLPLVFVPRVLPLVLVWAVPTRVRVPVNVHPPLHELPWLVPLWLPLSTRVPLVLQRQPLLHVPVLAETPRQKLALLLVPALLPTLLFGLLDAPQGPHD